MTFIDKTINVRPVFKKNSSFDGSKKKYQKKVWKAAAQLHPNIDTDIMFFNKCEQKGLSSEHVMHAIHYNLQPIIKNMPVSVLK